ncbi:MAG: hypothetical protein AAGC93_25655 [Cyanobacteria bacterium P01_F01_bin.53]
MNYLSSLILPAALGLVAGMGHGVVSHYAELPVSLGEQIVQPLQGSTTLRD